MNSIHFEMDYPLFSILIANYNNGCYLEECLESVFKQTYKNWQVIIVDDYSTDNSPEIYKKYEKDNRFRILFNKKNYGCGYTKKRCVDNAEGEICGFLDPDDTLEKDALSLVTEQHMQNISHSIIYSTLYWCNKDLKKEKIWEIVGKIPEGENQLTSTTKKIGHFASFKNDLYKKTVGINPKLKSAVDQDLYYKLEEQGPVLFIDNPLYNYRIHQKGISSMNINRLISYHSHLKVKKKAYLRRLNTNIHNINRATLNKEWLNSFQAIAIAYRKNKSYLKSYYYLIMSLRYLYYDKSFLTIKIMLSPLKRIC